MDKKRQLIVGITDDNEIYSLNINLRADNQFTMSGETNIPLKYSDAVRQSRQRLEDGEMWREAVRAEKTEESLDDWIDEVLSVDGEISQIDNSLMPDNISVDGEDYIFESGSCGQHEEYSLKHYFIDKNLFDELMTLWQKYHLKSAPAKDTGHYSVMEQAFQLEQDRQGVLIEAIKLITDK